MGNEPVFSLPVTGDSFELLDIFTCFVVLNTTLYSHSRYSLIIAE